LDEPVAACAKAYPPKILRTKKARGKAKDFYQGSTCKSFTGVTQIIENPRLVVKVSHSQHCYGTADSKFVDGGRFLAFAGGGREPISNDWRNQWPRLAGTGFCRVL
jgi:hypothetical protein